MVKLGITSSAYRSDSILKIDFKALKADNYECIDLQFFMERESFIYDLSDDEMIEYIRNFKVECDKHSIKVSQLHALWNQMAEKNERDFVEVAFIKAVKAASILDCPYVVFHPLSPISWDTPYTLDEIKEYNKKFINKMIPMLEEYNVSIALENLPFFEIKEFFSPLGTYEFVKSFNSDHVVMCLDTGHMNMFNIDPYKEILLISDKLKVLHIHDNNTQTDSHSFPYMGTINWEKLIKGLKEINFDGAFSFETCAPNIKNIDAKRHLQIALSLIGLDFVEKLNN